MNRNYVNLNTNPCKMCMPIGGCLALKGIEQTMVMMHGSQGCSTYMRRHISTHYNEPVDIASSALNEKETVYGGEKNLKKGLANVIKMYEPKVIGVLTTCLAETIGEDIRAISESFKTENNVSDLDIVTIATPGYGASQYEGYFAALKALVTYFAKDANPSSHINVITTLMTPADQRLLKEMLSDFGLSFVLLPDISETLDAPYETQYHKIPKGGTKREDIARMGGAIATIEIGQLVYDEISPGYALYATHGVPLHRLPMPIGITQTDALLDLLSKLSGNAIPDKYVKQRGRMLDAMVDSHKYNGEGRAAIFGDPEIVLATTALCAENGIKPEIIATGTQSKTFKQFVETLSFSGKESAAILDDTDFDTIQKLVRERGVNLLIGNSDGKFVMEKEGVPLVRIGFPIHDQVGAQRKCYIGYEGSLRFLDDLTNTILDHKHMHYRRNVINTYFKPTEAVEKGAIGYDA